MTDTVTPPEPLQTAVLFLIFNRPDTTAQVFEAIRKAKPPRLYVAADGPRADREGEAQKVDQVRAIATAVDWPCELKTLFRDENLGCKYAVSGGITWFFEQEEQGIILEDDCLPTIDFFYFAEDSLYKYKNDTRIMMITGTNYLSSSKSKSPFFFSEHFTIWGWATWRRAWKHYDIEMKNWDHCFRHNYLKNKFKENYIYQHFKNTFDALNDSYVDTWDIQWVFACLSSHGLCLTPAVNLISNIGVEGTHGSGLTDSHFIPTRAFKRIQYKEAYPSVRVNYAYDIALHGLKNKKAVRTARIRRILKRTKLLNFAKSIRRMFRLILR